MYSLQNLRDEIDAIDDQLFTLLHKRAAIVEQVGHLKRSGGEVFFTKPDREFNMIKSLQSKLAALPEPKYQQEALSTMWRTIITASLMLENEFSIGFFEPEAQKPLHAYYTTFCPTTNFITKHQALQALQNSEITILASLHIIDDLKIEKFADSGILNWLEICHFYRKK